MADTARRRQSLFTSRRTWLQAAVLAGMAALVAWRVDLAEAWDVFTSIAPGYAALGVALLVSSNVVHAKKWQHLLSGVGPASMRDTFAVFWSSMATNNVIPLRAGDVLRVQVMSQRTGLPRGGIVASLLTERLLDGLSFVVLIAVALAIGGRTNYLNFWALAALAIFVAIIAVTVAAARSRPGPRIAHTPLLRVLPTRPRKLVADFIPHAIDGLRPLGEPRSGLLVAGWALFAWSLEAAAFVAWGEAFRVEAGPEVFVLVMVAVNVASSITILPANLGLFELTAVGILRAGGIEPSAATAYAVGTHLLIIATIALVGIATLGYLRLSLSDVFYLRRAQPEDTEQRVDPHS